MRALHAAELRNIIHRCADIVAASEAQLTDIDSRNGDGDLGISMKKGFTALCDAVDAYVDDDIGAMLAQGGAAFNRAAPSTMGTLLSMSLVMLGKGWTGKTELDAGDIVTVPGKFAETIGRLGKSAPGDKTILDALCPFAQTLTEVYAGTGSLEEAFAPALEAAKVGLDSTRGMTAMVGRARWLGETAAESCDGGALLCVLLLEGLGGTAAG